MRIIVEEYPYPDTKEVRDALRGLVADLENLEGRQRVNYVGYYFNPYLNDTVFCLPKVVLQESKEDDKKEKVFGLYSPEDILDQDYWDKKVRNDHKDFLFHLSVWIYRAINVYKQQYPNSNIIKYRQVQIAGRGKKTMPDTFLDILLALIRFNKDNRDFLLFTIKNIHSGHNKINWTRTISHSQAFLQDNTPVYLNPVNKKKQVNFDEELLVIYYSILEYLRKQYGFRIHIDEHFNLFSEGRFKQYQEGLGSRRLLQIKYKYFSDKALELWQLCYVFFDYSKEIAIATDRRQYLLVQNFNIVFEAMIDELIGTPEGEFPKHLKLQKDGKMVDHLYKDTALSSLMQASSEQRQIYYIGDSKYYKMHRSVDELSEYKQYTYAKNIIHLNLDMFLNGDSKGYKERDDYLVYRDPITEGYEITPNFFISADLNPELDYNEKLEPLGDVRITRQFENRLFDRDTLLLSHYDVNFLHVLSLYARDKAYEKASWKASVRKQFRERIKTTLQEKFAFYAMTAREGVNAEEFFKENFQQLLGKVYNIHCQNERSQQYYALALDSDKKYEEENVLTLALLEPYFYYTDKYTLGDNPAELLQKVNPIASKTITSSYLTQHHIERYLDKYFLIGCYHSQAQLDWILGINDKGTNLYNVRLKTRKGPNRDGSIAPSVLNGKDVKFVILYDISEAEPKAYRVFHVHHHATMTEGRMRQALYPDPEGSYFCYVFDEETTLGKLNISQLLIDWKQSHPAEPKGFPIFLTGEQLIKYRTLS